MGRKYIDCREHPSDVKCSLTLSADSEDELLEAVVQHVVSVHGYSNTPDVRDQIRKEFKDEAIRT